MQGLGYNCSPVVALWNAAVFCHLIAKANHGLKYWRIFFVTFLLLTSYWRCCCAYPRPFHHGHISYSCWPFDCLLLATIFFLPAFYLLLVSHPLTFSLCSHSHYDHLCFLPVISSLSFFSWVTFSSHSISAFPLFFFQYSITQPRPSLQTHPLASPSLSCPSLAFGHHTKFTLTPELLFVPHIHFPPWIRCPAVFTPSLTPLMPGCVGAPSPAPWGQ